MAHEAQVVEVDGHQLKLTNLDKVLYPATGTTKGEVLQYYLQVAPALLPYTRGRAATRKRWPNGVGDDGDHELVFFTKNLDSGTPAWVHHHSMEHADRTINYPLIDDVATLVLMAQLAALELHVPQWRFDDQGSPQPPDRLVLDLDPGPGVDLPGCAEVARWARPLLEEIGLVPCPVTSGSLGIHLYAQLDGSHSRQEATDIAHEIAHILQRQHPDRVTSQMKKTERYDKVFIDWSQNNGNKTTVAPYSLRGRAHPTVAAPRTWDELDDPELANLIWSEVLERVDTFGDLLAPVVTGEPLTGDVLTSTSASQPGTRRTTDRLTTYRGMRDGTKTPEPVPPEAPVTSGGRSFVIQEHHARALHYDFRLENEGVLVSWAVPKGVPTTVTKNHLAVHTEDHPLEYGSFEGSIPAGEYGGGTVTIWDQGRFDLHKWRPADEVIVTLHGRPEGGLAGRPTTIALIHTGKGDGAQPKSQWLMHRMKSAPDYHENVASGSDVAFPDALEPMQASDAESLSGSDWRFEADWTGSRCIVLVAGGHVRLLVDGSDVTGEHAGVVSALSALAVESAVLDAVLASLDGTGEQMCVVDVLQLDGKSLLRRPWAERRALLDDLLGTSTGRVQVSPLLPGDLDDALELAGGLGLDGVIAKKTSSVYQPGKTVTTWSRVSGHAG